MATLDTGGERATRPGTIARATRRGSRCAPVRARLLVLLALAAPQALADFPYLGNGTAGDPSSWTLAPGQVPSNLGGLGWKFAATPAPPPAKESDPAGYLAVTQNNSQQDELCGVTGMSLVDSHAT